MATSLHASPDRRALRLSSEQPASTFNGFVMLGVTLIPLAGGLAALGIFRENWVAGLAIGVASAILFLFVAAGFYLLQPNQAAALLLFGDYRGTDRNSGLRWRWPWLTRTKISTRVHNVTSERLKVNDLRGNPIEIATNVV
ncbi:MAG TPA: SPFH domain-containing protein, partial [Allosphingosinicella sp.]